MIRKHHVVVVIVLAVLACIGGCTGQPSGPLESFPPRADVPADLREPIDQLESADPHQRAYAALVLGRTRRKEILPFLLFALKDPSYLVRSRAAEALGKRRHRGSDGPLIALLENGREDPEVRSRAAEALGLLKSEQAVEPLIATLTDTVWDVRYQAVVALGRIGDPAAKPPLANVARYDPISAVRLAAQKSLENLEQASGVPQQEDLESS